MDKVCSLMMLNTSITFPERSSVAFENIRTNTLTPPPSRSLRYIRSFKYKDNRSCQNWRQRAVMLLLICKFLCNVEEKEKTSLIHHRVCTVAVRTSRHQHEDQQRRERERGRGATDHFNSHIFFCFFLSAVARKHDVCARARHYIVFTNACLRFNNLSLSGFFMGFQITHKRMYHGVLFYIVRHKFRSHITISFVVEWSDRL